MAHRGRSGELLLYPCPLNGSLRIGCAFASECHSAGGESSSEEPAQATGNSERQPAGSDCGGAETDGFFTGEQYHATDAERQAAGNPHTVGASFITTFILGLSMLLS